MAVVVVPVARNAERREAQKSEVGRDRRNNETKERAPGGGTQVGSTVVECVEMLARRQVLRRARIALAGSPPNDRSLCISAII